MCRCPASRSRPGSPLPLHFYQSIAVDPSVIPLGSRVYVPAYRNDGYGGWFLAQDTGGAIGGRHIDVYRTPAREPERRRPVPHRRADLRDRSGSLTAAGHTRLFRTMAKQQRTDAGRAAQPARRDAAAGEPLRRGARGRDQVQGRGAGDSRRARRRALRRQGRASPLPARDRRGAPPGAPAAAADGRCVTGARRAPPR